MSNIGWIWQGFPKVSQKQSLEMEQNDDPIQTTAMVEPSTRMDESMEMAQNDDTIPDVSLIEPALIDEGSDTNNGKISIFYL